MMAGRWRAETRECVASQLSPVTSMLSTLRSPLRNKPSGRPSPRFWRRPQPPGVTPDMKRFPLLLVGVFAAALGVAACAATRAGYETAPYEVLRADGAFELRAYPELPLVTTGNDGADGSFMRLFRYISGANATQEKIAMTTPVFMVDDQMAFVLPAEKRDAPAPSSKDVRLEKRPASRVAVLRFSGRRSVEADDAALKKLRAWMAQQGLKETGKAFSASYDPPWTPGPMRRNEVLVPVGE